MTDTSALPDATLAALEATIQAAAFQLLQQHERVALGYSGGADSGLLLHLLRPVRQQIVVVWVNPGSLPHEADHVLQQAGDGPFVEIPSDREAAWRQDGLPSYLIHADRCDVVAGSDADAPSLRLLPPPFCCTRIRTMPATEWLTARGFTLLIHGQRRGEGTALFAAQARPFDTFAPLARWTREMVMRRVAHHGVPLPLQYREGFPETIECAVCPSNLAPARLAFLRRHYPAEHAETLRLARGIMGYVGRMTRAYEGRLVEAEAVDTGD